MTKFFKEKKDKDLKKYLKVHGIILEYYYFLKERFDGTIPSLKLTQQMENGKDEIEAILLKEAPEEYEEIRKTLGEVYCDLVDIHGYENNFSLENGEFKKASPSGELFLMLCAEKLFNGLELFDMVEKELIEESLEADSSFENVSIMLFEQYCVMRNCLENMLVTARRGGSRVSAQVKVGFEAITETLEVVEVPTESMSLYEEVLSCYMQLRGHFLALVDLAVVEEIIEADVEAAIMQIYQAETILKDRMSDIFKMANRQPPF